VAKDGIVALQGELGLHDELVQRRRRRQAWLQEATFQQSVAISFRLVAR
jgi:hypothetical protein